MALEGRGRVRQGRPRSKEGDDYPLRVHVLFEYDPDRVEFWQKAKYELAKAVYGEHPPLASPNYVVQYSIHGVLL